jgi:cobalt-zinc-cadmium efflux system membrane fusion protein
MSTPTKKALLRRLLVLGGVGLLVVGGILAFWLDPLGVRAAWEGEKPPREKVEEEKDSGVRLVPAPEFAELDKNADRRLTLDEMRGLPFFGPNDQVAVNFGEIDPNEDGRIDAKEYAAYVKRWWNRITVPADVEKALGIGGPKGLVVATLREPTRPQLLTMPGSTDLDPTTVSRIRARFQAEVVEIGKATISPSELISASPLPGQTTRELRPGDEVHGPFRMHFLGADIELEGDLLAVVWSTDVGSRKSDLVDALVQLTLDERRLRDRIKLWQEGSIPRDTLDQTRRDVASDRSAVERAERTLRTWRIPEKEIQAVRDEAAKIVERGGQRDRDKERLWARSEIRSPRDGTIVERNIALREYIADTTTNLFVIADVNRLLVRANTPEDDLMLLLALPPQQRVWRVHTVGLQAQEPTPIDEISRIIDQNQHTVVVKGYIDNPGGRLRAGQYATATVEIPPPRGVVEVPVSAVVDDHVFVQDPPNKSQYTLRRVLITHRFSKSVYVKSTLTPQEAKLTADDRARELLPRQPLRPGERVLTAGVLELKARLAELKSTER